MKKTKAHPDVRISTISAIKRYVEHYGLANKANMCQFFGIHPKTWTKYFYKIWRKK
jgi:hypothetical protein